MILHKSLDPKSIPQSVLILAISTVHFFVADQEINMLVCLTEIMTQIVNSNEYRLKQSRLSIAYWTKLYYSTTNVCYEEPDTRKYCLYFSRSHIQDHETDKGKSLLKVVRKNIYLLLFVVVINQ